MHVIWTAVAVAVAAFSMTEAGGAIILITAISMVGLPVALVMSASPAIALYLLISIPARAIVRLLPIRSALRAPLIFALVFAAGAIPAWLLNRSMVNETEELTAGDRKAGSISVSLKAPAILLDASRAKGAGGMCHELCQRLLLAPGVARVLLVPAEYKEFPSSDTPVNSYRFERRATCNEINIGDAPDMLDVPRNSSYLDRLEIDQAVRLRTAQGDCLIRELAPLSDADGIVTFQTLKMGGRRAEYAGVDAAADSLSASRMAFYLKRDGGFEELVRDTFVTSERHPVILIPYAAPVGLGTGTKGGGAFYRNWTSSHPEAKSRYYRPSLWSFLVDDLGLDLTARPVDDTAFRVGVSGVFDKPGSFTDQDRDLVACYADELTRRGSSFSKQPLTDPDRVLAVRLIGDIRFDLPQGISSVFRDMDNLPPGLLADLADAAFRRLKGHAAEFVQRDAEGGRFSSRDSENARMTAGLISTLPPEVLLAYRDDIEWALAQDIRAFRVDALALTLSEFGSDGAFALADTLWMERKSRANDRYVAALVALCRMGPAASAALPQLLAAYETGEMWTYASYWDLTIHTLIQMGADPETVWRIVEDDAPGNSPSVRVPGKTPRELFDRELARVSTKPDCGY